MPFTVPDILKARQIKPKTHQTPDYQLNTDENAFFITIFFSRWINDYLTEPISSKALKLKKLL